ncbi:hypothetical protein [Burkholderia thailandensis]|nr:hypothetical protein [Burkholderia thailandensis]
MTFQEARSAAKSASPGFETTIFGNADFTALKKSLIVPSFAC